MLQNVCDLKPTNMKEQNMTAMPRTQTNIKKMTMALTPHSLMLLFAYLENATSLTTEIPTKARAIITVLAMYRAV